MTVVTLGGSGAMLVLRERPADPLELPAVRVNPVDTTGAGDAFNGALAAALAEGRPLEDAARRAVAAGGLATTKVGAREASPTAAELDAVVARI